MTESVNKFNKAAETLQSKAHGAGYKKGMETVKIALELRARGINLDKDQNEK